MEAQLDRLLHGHAELAAKAAAAEGLHRRELAGRQQAQQAVARLRARLRVLQARAAAWAGLRLAGPQSTFAAGCFICITLKQWYAPARPLLGPFS